MVGTMRERAAERVVGVALLENEESPLIAG
jgi:hypothetical protein